MISGVVIPEEENHEEDEVKPELAPVEPLVPEEKPLWEQIFIGIVQWFMDLFFDIFDYILNMNWYEWLFWGILLTILGFLLY